MARALLVMALLAVGSPALAQTQGIVEIKKVSEVVPAAAAASPLDPAAATRAYLDTLTPEQRERSDSYFEGGYWLLLWSFLIGSAISLGLLHLRVSARLRDWAERRSRHRWLQTALYWAPYALLASALTFPWSVYTDFFREHHYGLSTMSFGAWLGDQLKGLAISLLMGAIAITLLYAVIRRLERTWWIWGTVVAIGFMAFSAMVAPVFIAPLFNKYTPLSEGPVRSAILSLAHANGVEANDVYQFDASRQHNRISANVSGLGATQRISLNDNLLLRCSQPQIEAVMAHELGHYVLNHIVEMMVQLAVVLAAGFAFVSFAFRRVTARYGERWGVHGVGDVAGLPLLSLLLSVYFFVATPVMNTIIRTNEAEADLFGINAARQPDGFAQVSLALGEYRKLDPGPLEEWFFFDHPSGRARIRMAMDWKAQELKRTPPATP